MFIILEIYCKTLTQAYIGLRDLVDLELWSSLFLLRMKICEQLQIVLSSTLTTMKRKYFWSIFPFYTSFISPIFQWLFQINIFVTSKIKLLKFSETYVEKFHKCFWFFHWNPYLKTDIANLLFLLSINDFHKKIYRNIST